MNKLVKRKKLQFALLSLLAVAGILGGSFQMKKIGAHRVLSFRSAEAQVPAGLRPTQVAPDVTYDAAALTATLPAVQEGETASTVPVLLYHGLVEQRDRFSMTPELFREQMFALKRNGFRTLTMQQYLDFRAGKPVPARSFLLTFDDGRADSYAQADPVLKATGFTAVMFIAGQESLNRNPIKHNGYYINAEDVRAMSLSGRWEIESHAVQQTGGQIVIDGDGTKGNFLSNYAWHPLLNRLETAEEYEKRIRYELEDNRERVAEATGIVPRAFSYPYGDYGQQQVNNPDAAHVIERLVGETYDVAFRQVWDNDPVAKANSLNDARLQQKRIEVDTAWSGTRLVQALARVIDKPLPYGEDFSADNGWRTTWGLAVVDGGTLTVKAKPTTTGANAILEGSNWQDFALLTRYDWVKGESVTIVGRYKDARSYVQCVYVGNQVRLDAIEDGKLRTVAQATSPVFIEHNLGEIGMRAAGDKVSCAVSGIIAVTGTVPVSRGSVGFKVWDPKQDNAEMRVTDIRVTVP